VLALADVAHSLHCAASALQSPACGVVRISTMDPNLLQGLLYQNESETLDFKIAQYPFDKATDEKKSELLKDILAFANAWRQSDAYILIGVQEVKGGRSIAIGIADHLLNRNLQQFVQSKTNRPVAFSYSAETLDGAQIGVISIPIQDRPVFLKKDYGNLRSGVVYIRRGDTTGEADPDEIFRMGSSAAPSAGQPILVIDLFEPLARQKVGHEISLDSVSVQPIQKQPPAYGRGNQFDFSANPDYYRELGQFARETTFLCPIGIAVTNTSTTCAEDVIVTIQFESASIVLLDDSSMPERPSKLRFKLRSDLKEVPTSTISVARFSGSYEVRAMIGTVQPGRTEWSTSAFYIGSRTDATVHAVATISANNLRVPKNVTLNFRIKASERLITPRDLELMEADFE